MATASKKYPKTGLAKTSEAAEFLSYSRSTVTNWCRREQIDYVQWGAHYRIRWEVLHDLANGHLSLRPPKLSD